MVHAGSSGFVRHVFADVTVRFAPAKTQAGGTPSKGGFRFEGRLFHSKGALLFKGGPVLCVTSSKGVSLPSRPSVPMDDMNNRLQRFCRFRVGFRIHKYGAPARLARRPVAWPHAGRKNSRGQSGCRPLS